MKKLNALFLSFLIAVLLTFSSITASAEVEYFQVTAQNRLFMSLWRLQGTEKVFAEAPTLEIELNFTDYYMDWYFGPYLGGGVLYSGGVAAGDVRNDAERLMPFGVLGFSVRKEAAWMVYPGFSGGLLVTSNGFGGEFGASITVHDGIGGAFFSGGLTAGYLTTGIEPGGDKLNYPFVGLRIAVGGIALID